MAERRVITAGEAARLLNISEATVRNWVRHGYLTPASGPRNTFYSEDVRKLKKQLARGRINRLKQRANKTGLVRTALLPVSAGEAVRMAQAQKIQHLFVTGGLDLERAMLALTARALVLKNEVRLKDPARMFDVRAWSGWRRQSLEAEMSGWLQGMKPLPAGKYHDLYQALQPTGRDDIPGLLYQSLLQEGNRSRQGRYYTPAEVLAGIVEESGQKGGRFLDPCCGTGRFLMRAARSGHYQPEDLVGFDNDPVAVRIARINLLLHYPDKEFEPRVFCLDVLDPEKTRPYEGGFRFIATNPPWGASLTPEQRLQRKREFPGISSNESFSFFLATGLKLLEDRGRLSFILPESFLNIRVHGDIRRLLLSTARLTAVHYLGKRFEGVLSRVIRIDVEKRAPAKNARTRVVLADGSGHSAPQSRFLKNDHQVIDAGMTKAEAAIIKKIYAAPHATLKGAADWALGIVTGDNRKYVSDTCRPGMEPVYRGKDIAPFRLKKPGAFLRFAPERFQQTAPEDKYRAREKLVYRFISRRLVFALDNSGALTLNSANILIPKVDDYPIKAVLGVLNSRVSQFVFLRKFQTHRILRGDLESLPLPLLGTDRLKALAGLVDRAMAGEDVGPVIDELLMTGLGLSEEQRRIVFEELR